MAPRPLSPATRYVVGWLLLLAGVLLALGLLLQLYVWVYLGGLSRQGAGGWSQLAMLGLGLAAAAVMAYYGQQLRRRSS